MEGAVGKYQATESIGVVEREEQEAQWWEQEHTEQSHMFKVIRKQVETIILHTDKRQVEKETTIILTNRQQ